MFPHEDINDQAHMKTLASLSDRERESAGFPGQRAGVYCVECAGKTSDYDRSSRRRTLRWGPRLSNSPSVLGFVQRGAIVA